MNQKEDSLGVEINATLHQIREFKDSVIWNDIVTELRTWVDRFEIERKSIVDDAASTNPSTASVLLHIGDLNGRNKAIEYILAIPDVFESIIEARIEDEQKSLDMEEN
jgi:hypothetical protein